MSAFAKYLTTICAAAVSAAILCFISVIDYPNLGHDYAYIVPFSLDLAKAWNEFGVINPEFSALRCLGLPLWANPNSFTFSVLHLFSVFFEPITAVVVSYAVLGLLVFFGAYLFSGLFLTDVFVKICFAIGWTLQAKLVLSVLVGHFSYVMLGLFPLIFTLLIQRQKNRSREIAATVALILILTQFVFNAALYLVFIFVPAVLIAGISLHLLGFEFKSLKENFRYLIKRNSAVAAVSFLLCLPKLAAVYDWMANYPRHVSFVNAGILNVLEYSFFNMFVPGPFDAKSSVGWSYGNWESNQNAFPFLAAALFLLLLINRNFSDVKKLLILLGSIFGISVLINSGVYADVFAMIPVLKSMHVNPRWNTIILFPLFAGFIFLVAKNESVFKRKYWIGLSLVFLVVPFLYIDRKDNNINYPYLDGYKAEQHRLVYCYEPIFGYKLETLPVSIRQYDLLGTTLVDPRCYLKSGNCAPGAVLDESGRKALEEYQLE